MADMYGKSVRPTNEEEVGKAQHEPKAARRAFEAMEAFFAEAFARD